MWGDGATRGAGGRGRNMALALRRQLGPWQTGGPVQRIYMEAAVGDSLEMGWDLKIAASKSQT